MRTARNKKGFTLAEILVVVAIVLILAALIAVGVQGYMRSMTKLEYDGYAKEIFIAAQNHLAVAKNLNYLDLSEEDGDFGTPELDETGAKSGVYYLVIRPGETPPKILGLMLPNGALAFDSVGQGVSYIVRYHKDSGQVLDVFYWTQSGQRYNLSYRNDYITLMQDKSKSALRNYRDGSVVGYYGGLDAEGLVNDTELKAPSITLVNSDTLYVTVTDNNGETVKDMPGYTLRLIVSGVSSGATKTFTLDSAYSEITLDDITTSGKRFDQLGSDDATLPFWPGEDVEVHAEAVVGSFRQSSVILRDNSLYGTGTTAGTNAKVYSFRHLENLGGNIAGFNSVHSMQPARAEQTADLNWSGFFSGRPIYGSANSTSANGYYIPVEPKTGLEYDGGGNAIIGYPVDSSKLSGPTLSGAGIFSALTKGSVSNLRLENFTVSGSAAAGALAGSADDADLVNVLACGSASAVRGRTDAGGLVGSMTDGAVRSSAAAVLVTAENGSAGGLLGAASGTSVRASYAGGHTENGKYVDGTYYNVTAMGSGAAGGLIGAADGVTVRESYSTCSARSYSGAAGGLSGSGSGTFTACYATGLVKGSVAGAFAGSLGSGSTLTDCSYYMLINERRQGNAYVYLAPLGSGSGTVTALDKDTATYDAFVGGENTWDSASAYDASLNLYYGGAFPLKTVAQLAAATKTKSPATGAFVDAHYGDWPAPDLFVINK